MTWTETSDIWARSRASATRFEYLPEVGSTNDELRARVERDEAARVNGSVLVTDNQTRGKGRLGRTWLAPSGKTLAVSVLFTAEELNCNGQLAADAFGWIPLIAGLAVARTVSDFLSIEDENSDSIEGVAGFEGATIEVSKDSGLAPGVAVKWPNDVQISGFKVSGILTEMTADRSIIVGAGINLTLDEHDLPTLSSTSLLLASGRRPDSDSVLANYLQHLAALINKFVEVRGDPDRSGIRQSVTAACSTIGMDVRVEMPGDVEIYGTVEGLDLTGRILVRELKSVDVHAISAGDITHLR